MKILFIGSSLTAKQKTAVIQSDKSYNFSGCNFNEKLMLGLSKNLNDDIQLLSIPAVGYYKKKYPKLWMSQEIENGSDYRYTSISLLNLPIIKDYIASYYVCRYAKQWYAENKQHKCIIIIGSASRIMLTVVRFLQRVLPRDVHFSLIVPDIPIFLSLNIKSLSSRIRQVFSKTDITNFDSYTLLTKYMNKFTNTNSAYVVVEGIAEINNTECNSLNSNRKEVILYTGTLRSIFGIRILLDAFAMLPENLNIELWICGSGEESGYITEYAKTDKRVKYYGLVHPEQARSLQQEATILVNPRTSDGEYTYYSFPSKIMEYLQTGTSTIMNMLPGIPEEYRQYVYVPSSEDAIGLRDTILEVMYSNTEDRKNKNIMAQQFIRESKNTHCQCEKIINMIDNCVSQQ